MNGRIKVLVVTAAALALLLAAVVVLRFTCESDALADDEPVAAVVEPQEERPDVGALFAAAKARRERQQAEDEARRLDGLRREAEEDRMMAVLERMQPWYVRGHGRTSNGRRLVGIIADEARSQGFSPWLAMAVAYRESSLLPSVGNGRRNGALGERGYFQIMPFGYAEWRCGRGCDQHEETCNTRTAMCFLDLCRERCGDDPWMYVGGYGRSQCPSSRARAQTYTEVLRARYLLCEMLGEEGCNEVWPL